MSRVRHEAYRVVLWVLWFFLCLEILAVRVLEFFVRGQANAVSVLHSLLRAQMMFGDAWAEIVDRKVRRLEDRLDRAEARRAKA